MSRMILPIFALLLSTALLVTGHGLLLTLLPLRAEINGLSTDSIGLTASFYFLGFVFGCLIVPYFIKRVGHIRTFAILATTYSCLALLFHSTSGLVFWCFMRFLVGVSISGLYTTLESWLNERSTSENRGAILSVYTVLNFITITIGQLVFNLAPSTEWVLFGVASILISLAIIPIAFTLSLQPAPIHGVKIYIAKLWRLSNVGVYGAVLCGLVTGGFWSMGALYARGVGLNSLELTLFMSAVVLGGALFQFPLGRMSDQMDRRKIVLATTTIGFTASSALAMLTDLPPWITIGLAFIWGGGTLTIYAICLAHANDQANPDEFLAVGSGMLLILGVFSAIGAYAASWFIELFGPQGLFVFSALALLLLIIAVSIRTRIHELPEMEEVVAFRTIPRTSPFAFDLDPRQEPADEPHSSDGPDKPEAP